MLKTLLKSEISYEISESVVVRMCYIVCKLWSMNHFDPQEHKEKNVTCLHIPRGI